MSEVREKEERYRHPDLHFDNSRTGQDWAKKKRTTTTRTNDDCSWVGSYSCPDCDLAGWIKNSRLVIDCEAVSQSVNQPLVFVWLVCVSGRIDHQSHHSNQAPKDPLTRFGSRLECSQPVQSIPPYPPHPTVISSVWPGHAIRCKGGRTRTRQLTPHQNCPALPWPAPACG